MKDLHSHIAVSQLIGAAVVAADAESAAIDLAGFQSCEIVLSIGIGGITFDATNKVEFVLTHSDDDVTYTPVILADVLGVDAVGAGGIIKSLEAAHAAAAAYRIGYKGDKRYIKLAADFSGTHGAGTPISAQAVKGHALLAPVADQA